MSAFSTRRLEIWRSSRAEAIAPISGAFFCKVVPTLMVRQTIEFMHEQSMRPEHPPQGDSLLRPFITGMRYWRRDEEPDVLIWYRDFASADELFQFDLQVLSDAIRQLELHTDINFVVGEISYRVDLGLGPEVPLLVVSRMPIRRGVGFEVEERELVASSTRQGDFMLSDKAILSQQHYSTGMALLAGEDDVSGLIDGAFMQFYLATESLLEAHKRDRAVQNGRALYGSRFSAELEKVVQHVYLARHRFFGHAHPKYLRGILDAEVAFDIAKQVLVARWCARYLLGLELQTPLAIREMRFYPSDNTSIYFDGRSELLDAVFALPR